MPEERHFRDALKRYAGTENYDGLAKAGLIVPWKDEYVLTDKGCRIAMALRRKWMDVTAHS
jgi:hypothetical protein